MQLRKAKLILALLAALAAPSSVWAQDWIYTFNKGDTLWSLCLEYSNKPGCWIELGKYNDITMARQIAEGTEVRIPVAWLSNVPEVAKVIAAQGAVHYDADSSGSPVAAVAGQGLRLGSTISTGTGSATIKRDDGSVVLLRPGTQLRLDATSVGITAGAATELTVEQGEIEVKVPPGQSSRFEVRTPSAIAAVRGTQYRLATLGESGGTTRGEVLEGAVNIAAGSSAQVFAGFGVLASKGAPVSDPRKLISAPVFRELPGNGPLPLHLRWNSDPDAVAWRVDLYDLERAGALIETRETTSTNITFSALSEACYRFVVRGVDAEGFNGLQEESQFCVEAAPVVAEEDCNNCWPGAAAFGVFLLLLAL